MLICGIDIGGSAVKGALVDVENGTIASERVRIETEALEKPKKIAQITAEIISSLNYDGPVGIGFPAPIIHNTIRMAANVHEKWIGVNAVELFSSVLGKQCYVLNDADAAGIAEMSFGSGRDQNGVVLMLTLGTGIGSAIFINRQLLPNTEFGHLTIRGKEAEDRASDRARSEQKMSWKKWSGELQEFLATMETLIAPDLIILGGGVSKKSDRFLPYIKINTVIKPASLLNEAGIIGAAIFACEKTRHD